MKYFAWIVLGLVLVTVVSCKSSDDPEKIALIADLPDNDKYMMDGKYVDIGIFYKQSNIEGFPIENYNKQWCLFSGTTYWKMDKSDLDEIAQEAGITLPSDMSLPFKDEWGSRLGAMGFFLGLGLICFIWIKFRPKTKILPPLYASSNKNNSANLIFRQHYKIKTVNGLNVNWSSFVALSASVLLPPGKCSIIFDYKEEKSEGEGTHSWTGNNLSADGIIEAGKTYLLKSKIVKENNANIIYTNIEECKGAELKEYLNIESKVGIGLGKILSNLD
jgi:hypothetical protein